jgi:hypothetical protein
MRFISIILAFSLLFSCSEASIIRINHDDTYQVAPDGNILSSPKEPKYNIISEKMYVNFDEVDSGDDSFHIPVGNNEWIETHCLYRDITGFYTFESDISKTPEAGYEKHWRCPYCNAYYPWGKPCTNPNCPSKFK